MYFPYSFWNSVSGGIGYQTTPINYNSGIPFNRSGLVAFYAFQNPNDLGFDANRNVHLVQIVSGSQTGSFLNYNNAFAPGVEGGGALAYCNTFTGGHASFSPPNVGLLQTSNLNDALKFNVTGDLMITFWEFSPGGPVAQTTYTTYQQFPGGGNLGIWGINPSLGGGTPHNITFYYFYDSTHSISVVSPSLAGTLWNFVCAWIDVNAGTINLQINNAAVTTATIPILPIATGFSSDANLSIGTKFPNNGIMAYGIDEYSVWNRILSSAEIKILYNGGGGLQYPWSHF